MNATDPIRAEDSTFENERRHQAHPVNTDPPKPTGPHEPTTRAEALAQAKEWGSTLSHWNTYCGSMGDRDKELQACAQRDLQEQQRLLLLAQLLPEQCNLDANAAALIAGREPSASLTIAATGHRSSQDEADSGIEEDARQARNFNALTAREEEYMALARSCSDGTLRQHCADYGMHSPEPARLRWLAGRCYILARRLEMGDPS